MESCDVCDGSGAEPGTSPKTCSTCKGSGQVHQRKQTILGEMVMSSDCPTCKGSGEVITDPCHKCDGRGKVRKSRILAVNIPAGVDDGTQIRLSGEGEPGEHGGPPGNLYVVITVKPHEFLKRRGNDLILEWNINIAQAALGATMQVPTIEGEEEIKIKPGTQSGTIINLRNKGVPKLRPDGSNAGTGDQVVVINVFVPEKLTPEQRQLFEQLSTTFGTDATPQPHTMKSERGFFDRLASFLSGE
jgi:molecular chaperone DnaJ